jgi:branched-subunit amino acid ABC-type transport system permease component
MAVVTVANAERDTAGAMRVEPVSRWAAASRMNWQMVAWPMLAVAVVAVVMCFAYRLWIRPVPIRLTAGYAPYAAVIAASAALERFLEPLSHFLLPSSKKKQKAAESRNEAANAAANPSMGAKDVQPFVQNAADDQADVETRSSERAILFWAIASVCGLVISGSFGLFLLQSVATSHVNPYLDIIVTGLTIGAGTKPTHDLIATMQAKAAKSA